jgi:hypothetical protein
MERKSYTITLYKKDARCKDGKMSVWYGNFMNQTIEEHIANLQETEQIARQFMDPRKIIIESKEFRSVKNLMTGKEMQIAADTPHCCDPSTETYWSM